MNDVKYKKSIGKAYLVFLFIGIIVGFLFYRSTIIGPWTTNMHKLRIVAIEVILVGVIPVIFSFSRKVRKTCFNAVHVYVSSLKTNKRNIAKLIADYILATIAGVVLHRVLIPVFHFEAGSGGLATVLSVMYVAMTLFIGRKVIWKHIAVSFAVIALICGMYFTYVVTPLTGVSWDDQIHYWNTLSLTQKIDGFKSSADETMVNSAYEIGHAKKGLHKEKWESYVEMLESKYQSRELAQKDTSGIGISTISYIPAAIGILFGRSLGLSWAHVFDMGKIFNLFLYIGVFTFAIKKVRYGKLFLALIGLIPTNLFMACSYSYDPWVTAWTGLGLAYFVSFLQTPEEKIEMKEYLLMLLFFAIGCMPKAVYFPMILPALFIPSSRFKNSKQAFAIRTALIAVCLALVASFVLPIVHAGGFGLGDTRGGAAVNSTMQVQFILSHPLETLNIFWNFIRDYFFLDTNSSAMNAFTYMAYLGTGKGWVWVIMVLFAVGMMDREEVSSCNWGLRIMGFLGLIITIILIVAALYVSFTSVGSKDVAGVQQRYLLPFILPAFYFMGTPGNRINRDKSETAIIPMAFMAYLFIYTVYCLCIA